MSASKLLKMREMAERYAADKIDLVHDMDGFCMKDGRLNINTAGGTFDLELTRPALYQLMDRLGAPEGYRVMRDHLLPNAPKAADAVVNELLRSGYGRYRSNGRSKRVRTRTYVPGEGNTGTARAVLSDRYTPYDAPQILEQVGAFLEGANFDVVRGSYLARDGGNLKVILYDVDGGDGHYGVGAGITWDEIGQGSIRMYQVIQRHSCKNSIRILNGSLGNARSQLKHIGLAEDIAYAIRLFFGEAIGSEAMEEAMRKLAVSRTVALPNATEIVSRITRAVVGKNAGERPILRAIKGMEGYESLFGVINGLTYVAQDYETSNPDHMDGLEALGGEALMLADLFQTNPGSAMRKLAALAPNLTTDETMEVLA